MKSVLKVYYLFRIKIRIMEISSTYAWN